MTDNLLAINPKSHKQILLENELNHLEVKKRNLDELLESFERNKYICYMSKLHRDFRLKQLILKKQFDDDMDAETDDDMKKQLLIDFRINMINDIRIFYMQCSEEKDNEEQRKKDKGCVDDFMKELDWMLV